MVDDCFKTVFEAVLALTLGKFVSNNQSYYTYVNVVTWFWPKKMHTAIDRDGGLGRGGHVPQMPHAGSAIAQIKP